MRIVIAEDAVLLREGLIRLLVEAGHQIVAAADNGPDLVSAIDEHRPEISIVDVRMPPSHTDEGIRAALRAREQNPGSPVLVLSQYVEESYASDLLAGSGGGVGYLLKDRVLEIDDFLDGLTRVAAGGTVLDPEVVSQLLVARKNPISSLTPRETDVLGLMAEGRTNTAISQRLVVSDGAVEKHISNIFAKLGLAQSDSDHRRVMAVLAYLRA